MSARQALCLTRLGRPYLLSRQSAHRLVPISEETILYGPGVALLALDGLPALLVEPEHLMDGLSSVALEQGSSDAVSQAMPRLALMVKASGDVFLAIAADEVGPADESTQSAQWLDLRKGMTDVESI